jgi:hypothetical protein
MATSEVYHGSEDTMISSVGRQVRSFASLSGIALASLAFTACATRSVDRATQRCAGTERLLVRNETGSSVDVYAGSSMIGTVGPGTTELGIVPGTGRPGNFSGRRSSDGLFIQLGGPRAQLRFQVVCR